jgi:hypothetical protein
MLHANGGDRLQVRRRPVGGYESAEWYGGVRYESVLPELRYVQGLPASLTSFEPQRRRVWAALTRPLRRLSSGGWSSEFDFPVGPCFVARVSYRETWQWWQLSELDIRIAGGGPLADIAREELDMLCLC